jgi:hypothetical protein
MIKFTKRNTFQAAILTNTNYTFAIFNYEEIEWYASTSQGGNPETGTGGKAAKVKLFSIQNWKKTSFYLLINFFRLDLTEVTEHCGTATNHSLKTRSSCNLWLIFQMSVYPVDLYSELTNGFNQPAA